ncbi:Regulator of nucleoside diphosphate kinase [Chitinispirillum alkaliphilum]|nr:Regulator of nucleoside diphosphate kinase [Chitinispirillum alkaliphilum]
MKIRNIYITELDMKRLSGLITREGVTGSEKEYMKKLKSELDRAKVVKPQEIPPDVITMNSKVKLRELDTGDEMVIQLVFPANADVSEDRISVLAPIGTALIGYKVGDTIEWDVPKGKIELIVEEILYQPESEGNYEL